jgi:hypothetical protein
MLSIAITLAVFQLPIGWLNAAALENIPYMLVTFAVFQVPMGITEIGGADADVDRSTRWQPGDNAYRSGKGPRARGATRRYFRPGITDRPGGIDYKVELRQS